MNLENNIAAAPSSGSRWTWANIGGIAFFLIVVSLTVFRVQSFLHIPGQPNATDQIGFARFHNEIYFPTRALITGENPLDAQSLAAFHPDTEFSSAGKLPPMLPSTLLLYSAVGFLQLKYAAAAFAGLSVFLTTILSALLLRKSTLEKPGLAAVLLGGGLMLLCLPGTEVFFTYPNTCICAIGVALAIEYGHRKTWLSSLGLLLAFVQPAIGIPVAVLMLLRGNFVAVVGGLIAIAAASFAVVGYIHSNGGPPVLDAVYWQAFDLKNYLSVGQFETRGQSIPPVDLLQAISIWWGQYVSIDLSIILPSALLVLGGVAILAERTESQRIGVISRSGILISLMAILVFAQPAEMLMLLWIPVIGLSVDGMRSKQMFSTGMRFLLGLLLLLPLFNYFATPFLMERLKIGPSYFSHPDHEAFFSIRTILGDWNIADAAMVEWKLITTVNTLLIAVATLLIILRMLFSGLFRSRDEELSS